MLTGTFLDAESRRQFKVSVTANPKELLIYLPDKQILWKHSRISRSQAGVPGKLILKHGNPYAPDTLTFDEEPFTQFLRQQHIKAHYLPRKSGAVVGRVVLWLVLFCLLLLALFVAAWLLLMPEITAFAAKKVPRSVEQQFAKPMLKSFLAGEKVDSQKTVLVNRFYRRHKVPVQIPVNITVVQSDVVNAFAIPGGELVVYTGLLDKLQHPGQLAALLGHEAGHVQHRHSLISLVRNLSGHLVLVLLLQDAGGIMAVLVQNAEWLQQLAYSRDLELEADDFGLTVLQQNGYSEEHMAGLLQVLKSGNPDRGIPDFMSTHPAAGERIVKVQEWAKKHPLQGNFAQPDSAEFYWQQLQNQ